MTEIGVVLERHDDNTNHMVKTTHRLAGDSQTSLNCEHVLSYVTLIGVQSSGESRPGLFLSPTRGYAVSDQIADEGVNDLVFPQYWVL